MTLWNYLYRFPQKFVIGSLPFDILIRDTFFFDNNSVIIQYCFAYTFDEVSRPFSLKMISFSKYWASKQLGRNRSHFYISLKKPSVLRKLTIILKIFIVSANKYRNNCSFVHIDRRNKLLCCASPTKIDTFLTLLKITLVGGRTQVSNTWC